jgi:hypothetical protein
MSTLYNSNQIVIGAVLLFLIGYTFFIIRRMYKRRIDSLESKIVQLEQVIIKQNNESFDINNEQQQMFQNIVNEQTAEQLLSPLFNAHNQAFFVRPKNAQNNEPLEIIEEDNNEDVESYTDSDEEIIENKENNEKRYQNYAMEIEGPLENNQNEEIIEIEESLENNDKEEIIEIEESLENNDTEEIIETLEHNSDTNKEQKNECDNTSSLEKKRLELDEINSMTVAELKNTLLEYGVSETKGLKKAQIREMLISSCT